MRRKTFLFYLITLLVFGAATMVVLNIGSRQLRGGQNSASPVSPAPSASQSPAAHAFVENLQHPLGLLLLQVIIIIAAAQVIGRLFQKIGQPAVIGEMVAGILLGPSFFGLLLPQMQAFVFPASSLNALHLLSQIGVILFMFIVGIDLDIDHLRRQAQAAIVVSHASIVLPFFLGTSFTLLIYNELAPASVSFTAFALFMGVAMSITAFPVLARIIEERGLTKSPLGSLALGCAAVDDVTAWCLLAIVVAIVKANGWQGALLTIALTLLFISLMLFVFKPLLARVIRSTAASQSNPRGLIAGILAFVFAAALVTEAIGIHALFGAFLAGVIMPADGELRLFLRKGLESFSAAFLLPLFFAFTGLRTQIGLLNDGPGWLMGGGLIAVAVIGKLGGSAIAARWTGMDWHTSLSLGILMNTRGLVELIVLNTGYDLGILSPRIFAMTVLMALTTTFMTGPALSLLGMWKRKVTVATAS